MDLCLPEWIILTDGHDVDPDEQAEEIRYRVNEIAESCTRLEPGKKHYLRVYAALECESEATNCKGVPSKGNEAAKTFLTMGLSHFKKVRRWNERITGCRFLHHLLPLPHPTWRATFRSFPSVD